MRLFRKAGIWSCDRKLVHNSYTDFYLKSMGYSDICDRIIGELSMTESNNELSGELEVGRFYLLTIEELPQPSNRNAVDFYKDLIKRKREESSGEVPTRRFRE